MNAGSVDRNQAHTTTLMGFAALASLAPPVLGGLFAATGLGSPKPEQGAYTMAACVSLLALVVNAILVVRARERAFRLAYGFLFLGSLLSTSSFGNAAIFGVPPKPVRVLTTHCGVGVTLTCQPEGLRKEIKLHGAVTPGSKEDFEDAVALWTAFRMPLPPPSSVPIKLDVYTNDSDDLVYTVGILGTTTESSMEVYFGTNILQLSNSLEDSEVWNWEAGDAQGAHPQAHANNAFPEDTNAATSIQAYALGHSRFARIIPPAQHRVDSEWLGTPVDKSYRSAAALLIATNRVNQLFSFKSDWNQVRSDLIDLNRYKLLKVSKGWTNHGLDEVIDELTHSAVETLAPADSVEAAVANLVNCVSETDKAIGKVEGFNLQAVPSLIQALAGKRLTRTFQQGLGNSRPHIMQVSTLAAQMLIRIAKGELGAFLTPDDVSRVRDWYNAKLSGRVSQWLLENLVTVNRAGRLEASEQTFAALGACYPHLFRQAAESVIAHRPEVRINGIFMTLPWAKVSLKERQQIARRACRSPFLEHRYEASTTARRYDKECFEAMLLDTFDGFRTEPEGSYGFDERANFVSLAMYTESPLVWSSLERAIRNANRPFRLTLIGNIFTGSGDEGTQRALELLDQYLDDSSKPDFDASAKEYEGYNWGGLGEPCTVGMIATFQSAQLLGIWRNETSPKNSNDWRILRHRVMLVRSFQQCLSWQ